MVIIFLDSFSHLHTVLVNLPLKYKHLLCCEIPHSLSWGLGCSGVLLTHLSVTLFALCMFLPNMNCLYIGSLIESDVVLLAVVGVLIVCRHAPMESSLPCATLPLFAAFAQRGDEIIKAS